MTRFLSLHVLFSIVSITALVDAAVNKAEFPPSSQVPSVTSPQVKKWLSEIDLSGAPGISLNHGEPPECPSDAIAKKNCYWTCADCAADDVTDCPTPGDWGLTFDDGPTPATPALLDYLDSVKVKATFFMIGGNVVQHPELLTRQVSAGHHLASHTWSHHALTTLSNEQIVAEMKWTEKAIMDATGLRVRYMRPPYGDVDNRVRFVLKKLGYVVVDWTGDTFDSNDWKMPEVPRGTVVNHFKKSLTDYTTPGKVNKRGFVSLEHDLTKETVGVGMELIPFGLNLHLKPQSVAMCLGDSNPYALGSNMSLVAINGTTSTNSTIPPTSVNGSGTTGSSLSTGPKSQDGSTLNGLRTSNGLKVNGGGTEVMMMTMTVVGMTTLLMTMSMMLTTTSGLFSVALF